MPEQVILNGQVSVGQTPEGMTAIVVEVGAGRSYVLPLPDEAAQSIGKGLLAPRVVAPTAIMPNGKGRG